MADRAPSWNAVLAPRAGWASVAAVPEAELDDFARSLPARSKATARIVRGRRCRTKAELFQEWAAALQFPAYFGDNWDAFEECLADREWLAGDRHVVLLTEAHRVLAAETGERSTLLRILKAVGEAPGERELRIVFQCEAGDERAMRELLEREGIRA